MESVSITPCNIGHLRFELTDIYRLTDGHPLAGQIAEVPMFSYHIALPGRSLLVDAVSYDPEEIGGNLLIPGYEPPPPLHEQLAARGIDAAEITDVVITHAHFDHYGALCTEVDGRAGPAFPRARHYLSKADWHPDQFDDLEERTLRVVEQHGLLELTSGMVDLGDGLTILPVPGETPGHQMVYVTDGQQNFYFAGDLYHHPLELEENAPNVYWAAQEQMAQSKRNLMQHAASSGGLVYSTHIDGAYRVVEGKNGVLVWVEGL